MFHDFFSEERIQFPNCYEWKTGGSRPAGLVKNHVKIENEVHFLVSSELAGLTALAICDGKSKFGKFG